MRRVYIPNRWCVVKFTTLKDGTWKRVFCGDYGGFTGSDTWKISSAIEAETKQEHHIEFHCQSGSTYKCFGKPGMSAYMKNMYAHFVNQGKETGLFTIEIDESYV